MPQSNRRRPFDLLRARRRIRGDYIGRQISFSAPPAAPVGPIESLRSIVHRWRGVADQDQESSGSRGRIPWSAWSGLLHAPRPTGASPERACLPLTESEFGAVFHTAGLSPPP